MSMRLPGNRLLIVASDRLSAFDVVLPDPIPGKGEMLTQISNFWFARTAHLMPNHLLDTPVAEVLPAGTDMPLYARRTRDRAPAEAGAGRGDRARLSRRLGLEGLPGHRLALRHPPARRTAPGANACRRRSSPPRPRPRSATTTRMSSFDAMVAAVGADLAERVREATLAIYNWAAAYAAERGIIIADTKFEFGTDETGKLYVMDEMLTPDSSRFWPADEYRVGISPPSYDKQFVRDYLETLDWNKKAPGPRVPAEVIAATAAKYAEALQRLAGIRLD